MRRVTAAAVLSLSLTAFVSHGAAQSSAQTAQQNARQRQAAADAYDRGTTAYVDQAYGEAARWFETANRLAPAAPALMQAIRAHERNDNAARATTLARDLQATYREDANATSFARTILEKNESTLVRVEVSCDEDCKLDVDGKLEEHLTFYVAPQAAHHLIATFATGSQSADVQAEAGEAKEVTFVAPPPPPAPLLATTRTPEEIAPADSGRPPLPPLFTWIGLGVTMALGAATVVSALDAQSGVENFENTATMARSCMPEDDTRCVNLRTQARQLLDDGQGRELRTNILIGATAVAAVGTSVLAFALTDWSGGNERAHNAVSRGRPSLSLRLAPTIGGAATVLEGRF